MFCQFILQIIKLLSVPFLAKFLAVIPLFPVAPVYNYEELPIVWNIFWWQ